MKPRITLICLILLAISSSVSANVRWVEWDKAKVFAQVNQKLLFINYEVKVITNLWKLGPVLGNSKLSKLINDNFIPVWFNASNEDDKKIAEQLNLQENTITIMDDEGEVYECYNNADITDASEFEKDLQDLLNKIGLPPSPSVLRNLQRSLERAQKALAENKKDIAIRELLRMTERSYRCNEIKEAKELLNRIEDEAQYLVKRATRKKLQSKFDAAISELDLVSRNYRGLEIADLAKEEADNIRKSDEYRTWRREIRELCRTLWNKAREAESDENWEVLFNTLFDIYELEYPSESPKALRKLKKLEDDLADKDEVIKILDSIKLDRRCKRMLAEAEISIKEGDKTLAESMLNSVIKMNPSSEIIAKAKQLLKELKTSSPTKPDEPLKPSPHKY